MKRSKPVCGAIVLLFLAVLAWSSPAGAQTVPFKVYITELWQLDTNVDPVIGVIGDYYAKVTINGVEQDNKSACSDETSTGLIVPLLLFKNFNAIPECSGKKTPWAFTQQVNPDQPVNVKIQIFDEDLIFDDEADLKVGDGNSIFLIVDPTTGKWTGDVTWPQNCSRPNLNLGGNNANVCWQIGFDSDDDGLLDVWEQFGADIDNDGIVDVDLPALGASPLRKDVFVEADYLVAATHTHSPDKDAIERVVRSFANAPVANPDGTVGVQLHVDVGPLFGAGAAFQIPGPLGVVGSYGDFGGGNAIAEAGNEIIDAFGHGKGPGTNPEDLKAANFNPVREPIFRYAIFGHQTNDRLAANDCTTGVTNKNRREFLVTLGGTKPDGNGCWTPDANGFSVGSTFEKSGTFMHELGHTFGLKHGGDVTTNNKPNYLSVMNYTFQACNIQPSAGLLPGGCDYSRLVNGKLIPPLNETNLDECVGIAGGLGFGPVDWNGNGVLQGITQCGLIFENTKADVNDDGVCVSAGPDGTLETKEAGDDNNDGDHITDGKNRFCSTTVKPGTDDVQTTAVGDTPVQPDVLKSFNDWGRLSFTLIDFLTDGGVASGVEQEADATTLAQSRAFMSDLMAPQVTLVQTGPATAKPGDVVSYSLKITNTGRGPALSSSLDEKNPDGAVVTSDLGIISVGSQLTRPRTFTVPASACPGDLASADASLSFKDFTGQALTASTTTPLEILDVAAPAFDLTLSPAVLWPPDHKLVDVTATISSRDNCDPNPTVTLVSIASNEPPNNKDPDIQGAAFGTDDRTFSLRAERDTAKGATGRIYTVTYRVTDKSGNATLKSATVTVPTSNGGN
jgi:hypothetical protein